MEEQRLPGGIKQRHPTSSELDYFRINPNVAGMATEDDKVIINPYSTLSQQELEAVKINEAARVLFRASKNRPNFKLTEEQNKQFKSYGTAQDKRETVAARLFSGDPSAGKATPEQLKYIDVFRKNLSAKNTIAGSGGG